MAAIGGDSGWLTDPEVEGIAAEFLASDYAGALYVEWPLDRRLEGFLQYRGLTRIADDGDQYNMVLDRVMSSIGATTVHPR